MINKEDILSLSAQKRWVLLNLSATPGDVDGVSLMEQRRFL
jgi:hypothetical protein